MQYIIIVLENIIIVIVFQQELARYPCKLETLGSIPWVEPTNFNFDGLQYFRNIILLVVLSLKCLVKLFSIIHVLNDYWMLIIIGYCLFYYHLLPILIKNLCID